MLRQASREHTEPRCREARWLDGGVRLFLCEYPGGVVAAGRRRGAVCCPGNPGHQRRYFWNAPSACNQSPVMWPTCVCCVHWPWAVMFTGLQRGCVRVRACVCGTAACRQKLARWGTPRRRGPVSAGTAGGLGTSWSGRPLLPSGARRLLKIRGNVPMRAKIL